MKMGDPHLVPLSRQALAVLRELQPLARGGKYLFPSLRTRDRPMSDNTINAALRRMGYTSEEQTGHGFRSMASTLLNEQGFPPDVIELQLAHTERNKVRAAYNKAQRLPERRKMMQAWANYLDALREGAAVVPIRRFGVKRDLHRVPALRSRPICHVYRIEIHCDQDVSTPRSGEILQSRFKGRHPAEARQAAPTTAGTARCCGGTRGSGSASVEGAP